MAVSWAAALAFCCAPAGTVTSGTMPDLQAIAAAHGPVSGIDGYGVRLEFTDIWVRQSPDPDPPWRTSRGFRCEIASLSGPRHAGYERYLGAGYYPFHRVHRFGPHGGWRANLHDGWSAPADADAAAAALEEARRFAPALLVRRLLEEPTAVQGPEAAAGNRVRFRFRPRSGEPMLLDFDARTRLLREMRQGELTVAYDEYETVQGMAVSHRMEVTWRGDMVRRAHVSGVGFDAPFPEGLSAPAQLPVQDGDGESERAFRVRELGEGLYLAGGGVHYQVFVAFRDFLVALGGVAGVEQRLQAVRAITGELPLRYALISHHHADHLEGVPALLDAGAVLVASAAHEHAIRDAAGGREPRFAFVGDRREITDGERSLLFLELGPMRHSRHMLGAVLPKEKLLFSADLFVQPPGRPVRAANPPIRDLLEAVGRLDLDVTLFADTHTPVVSNYADLRLAASRPGDMELRERYLQALCPGS